MSLIQKQGWADWCSYGKIVKPANFKYTRTEDSFKLHIKSKIVASKYVMNILSESGISFFYFYFMAKVLK